MDTVHACMIRTCVTVMCVYLRARLRPKFLRFRALRARLRLRAFVACERDPARVHGIGARASACAVRAQVTDARAF